MKRVFVNGTFDVLHLGHLALLEFAAAQGTWLTVGIDSDRRVRELKGADRPVNSAPERRRLLESIRWVNEVKIFDTDQELIDMIAQHDIMVKGSDYRNGVIIGRSVCKQLIFFDRLDGYSSTQKIQDIAGRR